MVAGMIYMAGMAVGIGYATILCGSMPEVPGFDLHLTHSIPGVLWELLIGVWLIIKGHKASI